MRCNSTTEMGMVMDVVVVVAIPVVNSCGHQGDECGCGCGHQGDECGCGCGHQGDECSCGCGHHVMGVALVVVIK